MESSRRDFIKTASIGGLGAGILGTSFMYDDVSLQNPLQNAKIKITDIKVAIIGNSPVVRIITDAGIDGFGQGETTKPYLKPHLQYYNNFLIGEDPTNVERCLLKIRRAGSFKPWGTSVSILETALWDIAGKAANLPVYKLMGGKIRDYVRCYNTATSNYVWRADVKGNTPKDWHDWAVTIRKQEPGFPIIKVGGGIHGGWTTAPQTGLYYDTSRSQSRGQIAQSRRGPLSEYGLKMTVERVAAIKEGLGDRVDLAVDFGPGYLLADAIKLARALEPYNLIWLEDMLTGDYYPWVHADDYAELTRSTSTPIFTGEQIYSRHHYRELIEKNAIRVIGPDPADVGGIAELKWIAEFADLHGIAVAPHGVFNGLIGLAAHVMLGATLPENFIAFEYPAPREEWWYEIIEGLPDPIVKNGLVEVWDRPGLGVKFNVNAAKRYLSEEDKDFFD
jgi:L-alanine-DL-glutamate epimerase-like enolase superfamily enzyme